MTGTSDVAALLVLDEDDDGSAEEAEVRFLTRLYAFVKSG